MAGDVENLLFFEERKKLELPRPASILKIPRPALIEKFTKGWEVVLEILKDDAVKCHDALMLFSLHSDP
jgi:hypothetical protein